MKFKPNQVPIDVLRKDIPSLYRDSLILLFSNMILLLLSSWYISFLPILIISCVLSLDTCIDYRYKCTIVRIHDMNEELYKRLNK